MRQKFTFILSAVVLMLFVVNPSVAAQGGGNSDAAHLCQQGGYTGLVVAMVKRSRIPGSAFVTQPGAVHLPRMNPTILA